MFYKEHDTIIEELANKKDFLVNKITDCKNKLLYLYRLKKMCGCTDKMLMMAKNGIDERRANEMLTMYKSIFRCQVKKQKIDLTQQSGCSRMIFMMYRQIFGQKNVESNKRMVNGIRFQEYKFNDEFIENCEKIRGYTQRYNELEKKRDEYIMKMNDNCML